jgi:hypothetical protein
VVVQPAAVPLKAVFEARVGGPAPRVAEGLPEWGGGAKATHGLFWVYRYKADDRVPRGAVNFLAPRELDCKAREVEWTLPLPPVPDGVRDDQHYLVAEVIFHLPAKRAVNWRVLVDVETGAILYLRALVDCVNGLVFTYVWAFESESDARFVERVSAIFRSRGADVYLVELEATQDERLRRNETEFRLAEKPPKRDLAKSRAQLLELDAKHRLNSADELAGRPDYMRIDNTALSADEVAERVIQRFGIPVSAAMETV